jgi:hypothetical protein
MSGTFQYGERLTGQITGPAVDMTYNWERFTEDFRNGWKVPFQLIGSGVHEITNEGSNAARDALNNLGPWSVPLLIGGGGFMILLIMILRKF